MSARKVHGIGVGDLAPDFTLPDSTGTPRRLHDLLRQDGLARPAVLFFYPANFTPACTREACTFRDAYEDFAETGAVVIGVSPDSPESHARFAAAQRLPFVLLSDVDGAARATFGVPTHFGVLRGRVTFVIDASGVVRMAFNSPFRPATHVRKALTLLRTMTNGPQPDHQSVLR